MIRGTVAPCVLGFLLTAVYIPPASPAGREQSDDVSTAKPAAPAKPKSQRWQIGWAVDAGSAHMRTQPKRTTVARLQKLKRPADLPGTGTIPERYRTQRIKGVEDVIWRVRATIINVAAERDGDYRLLISHAGSPPLTCVLPDPSLAPRRGRFSANIDACRKQVAVRFHPTLTPRDVTVAAEIEGFGYFGKFNSDANKSPEGFQLHPVTAVRFRR